MGKIRSLTVPAQYDQIQKILRFVARGAQEAGLSEDEIFHVELCCDEASTNIIEHAYAEDEEGEINVRYQIKSDEFRIVFEDNGRVFNPDTVPAPKPPPPPPPPGEPVDDFIDNLQIGGLGIHFMRQLMDDVHFDLDKESGNTLTMVKKVSQ
jgi:serine/threonine-protein kinase RsbW